MDAMLEEEMIDLITFCLQNPDSDEVEGKKSRISEIGKDLYLDGGDYGTKILKNGNTEPLNLIN